MLRPLLRCSVALLFVTAIGCRGGSRPPDSDVEVSLFPLGVASGDATPDGAVLWTRYDGTLPLRLDVWQGGDDAPIPVLRNVEALVAPGGFVHAAARGLQPGETYQYAFSEQGESGPGVRSRVGRFRTALRPGALERISIGATSCTYNTLPLEILKSAGQKRLDAFLLLGDTVYADPSRTLAEFRKKWTENLSAEGYRVLRGSTSIVATYDDHEFHNDWTGETVDPDLRAAASRAFFEHTPLRRHPESPDRVWRSLRWGDTVELFVLDSRGERKLSTRLQPDGEYLSRAQMDWLKDGLSRSTATFKIILNSVPIGEFPDLFQIRTEDRWEGFPAQRTEILKHVEDQRLRGVVWLSGDFHVGTVGRPSLSGPGSRALEVLAGPGANFGNPAAKSLPRTQFDFASPTNNFVVLDLDPVSAQVRVAFHDEMGNLLFERTYTP